MDSWLDSRNSSAVQQALDSQTVQTAPERQTSGLTDQAFQSFLTNAPIPRVLLDITGAGQTIADNTATTVTFGATSRAYDPYNMLNTANAIVIPVAGFYTFFANMQFSPTISPQDSLLQFNTVTSKTYGAAYQLAIVTYKSNPSVLGTHLNLSMTRFFDAGDSFVTTILQNVGAGADLANNGTCVLGGAWVAPYKQYVTGSGGN
jgi:hypothetical protein